MFLDKINVSVILIIDSEIYRNFKWNFYSDTIYNSILPIIGKLYQITQRIFF